MTDEELYRCRCDLAERGFPADDWSDAEIEALPQWELSLYWDVIFFGVNYLDVCLPGLLEDIKYFEDNRPTNRLAILHLLPSDSVPFAEAIPDFGP